MRSQQFFFQRQCRGMEELLEPHALFDQPLFVGVPHHHFKLFAVGLDAIFPEVSPHERARVFKLLGYPR